MKAIRLSRAVRIRYGGAVERDAVAQRLLNAGIACRPAYMACHLQPVYKRLSPALQLPKTETAWASAVILPLYPQMTDAEQAYVIDTLSQALKHG